MQTSKIYKAGSLDDLIQVSEDILLQSKLRLWLLTGDLGAGKTTLIKAVLKNLNSMDEGSSPSYALINQYKTTSQPIYHIDLYRLSDPEEAFALGIEDYLYGESYCFVEWPQLILEYITPPYLHIDIKVMGDHREIRLMEVSE